MLHRVIVALHRVVFGLAVPDCAFRYQRLTRGTHSGYGSSFRSPAFEVRLYPWVPLCPLLCEPRGNGIYQSPSTAQYSQISAMTLDTVSNPNKTTSINDVFKSKHLISFQAELVASNRQRAVEIIQHVLPTSIDRLRALLAAAENDPAHPMHADQTLKDQYLKAELIRPTEAEATARTMVPGDDGKRFLDRLAVHQNQIQVNGIMVCEYEKLHIVAQELRQWLVLEVPVIEDGNSFGTEVQEHVLSDLSDASKQASTMMNAAREHHTDRQKLAGLWAEHPNLEDYAYSIAGSDRLDHFLARSHLRAIIRTYTVMLHKMALNWSKVVEPKGHGSNGGMY